MRTLFADITESGHLRGYCALDEDHSQLAAMQLAQPHDEAVHIVPLMGGGYIALPLMIMPLAGGIRALLNLMGRI